MGYLPWYLDFTAILFGTLHLGWGLPSLCSQEGMIKHCLILIMSWSPACKQQTNPCWEGDDSGQHVFLPLFLPLGHPYLGSPGFHQGRGISNFMRDFPAHQPAGQQEKAHPQTGDVAVRHLQTEMMSSHRNIMQWCSSPNHLFDFIRYGAFGRRFCCLL